MKNILITGSTSGIGRLAAIRLVKAGHTVYIHGRNYEKVETLLSELNGISNNSNIKGFVADLSDMSEVQILGEKINSEVDKIDVLINNAGVFKNPENINSEKLDIRFVVNFLAPFNLTNAIMPLIKNGKKPRVINLSSAAQAPVSIGALKGELEISVNEAYAQSKLALTMWSNYLAKKESELNVIAVNPGSLLNTKMANEAYGQYWSPAEKGSDILYDLAILDQYEDNSGKYFDNDNGVFSRAHIDAYDQEKMNELVSETIKILK